MGDSKELIDFMARILHDEAIGCELHYPPRPWTKDQIHKADAERLIRAIQEEWAKSTPLKFLEMSYDEF